MRKILCPTDLNTNARHAIIYGSELARNAHASLHLLHVQSLLQAAPDVDPIFAAELYRTSLENSNKRLKELVSELNSAGHPCEGEVASGFVAAEIDSYARANNIDLIITGRTSTGHLEEAILGSSITALIDSTTTPILTVPPGYGFRHSSNIVYATDFGEKSFEPCKFLGELAGLMDSTIHVLHITKTLEDFDKDQMSEFEIKFAEATNCERIVYTNEYSADIDFAISEFLSKVKADMIVLSHHRRNLFQRLLHQSKSRKFAHDTDVPCLILNT